MEMFKFYPVDESLTMLLRVYFFFFHHSLSNPKWSMCTWQSLWVILEDSGMLLSWVSPLRSLRLFLENGDHSSGSYHLHWSSLLCTFPKVTGLVVLLSCKRLSLFAILCLKKDIFCVSIDFVYTEK